MNTQSARLGFDRFIALRWANMALELAVAKQDPNLAFQQLKEWLSKEIRGKETARKTATQVRRLWFAEHDPYQTLRQQALDRDLAGNQAHWSLLHFGLALNVFPLLRDVCQITGRLLNLQTSCYRKDIYQRIQEKYGNPASTGAATRHVFQTLVDWGLVVERGNEISVRAISVDDTRLVQWMIVALMSARSAENLLLVDVLNAPELLGLRFQDARAAIHPSCCLQIERKLDIEMVVLKLSK